MPAEPAAGQAAYEAAMRAIADRTGLNIDAAVLQPMIAWHEQDETFHATWETIAEAVAAPLDAEITRLRDQLAARSAELKLARITWQETQAELQEVHDVLVTAYAGRELSEDTPSVVAALAAERDSLAAQLDQAESEADAEAEAAGMRLDRLRIADADLRRRLDDLASQWEHEADAPRTAVIADLALEGAQVRRVLAAQLREALEGGGDADR